MEMGSFYGMINRDMLEDSKMDSCMARGQLSTQMDRKLLEFGNKG